MAHGAGIRNSQRAAICTPIAAVVFLKYTVTAIGAQDLRRFDIAEYTNHLELTRCDLSAMI